MRGQVEFNVMELHARCFHVCMVVLLFLICRYLEFFCSHEVEFRHIQGPGATVLSIGLGLLMAALCVSLCVFVLDILLPRAHVLNSLAIFPSPWQSLSAHIPNLTDMSETTKKNTLQHSHCNVKGSPNFEDAEPGLHK